MSSEFLTYQLPTVGYWPTVALTGNGELGFDSGEGACETATTSKEGSRRANYPILTQGGSDKKYQYEASTSSNWNECDSQRCTSINWRASLVPAAAVIPAPIAYKVGVTCLDFKICLGRVCITRVVVWVLKLARECVSPLPPPTNLSPKGREKQVGWS